MVKNTEESWSHFDLLPSRYEEEQNSPGSSHAFVDTAINEEDEEEEGGIAKKEKKNEPSISIKEDKPEVSCLIWMKIYTSIILCSYC